MTMTDVKREADVKVVQSHSQDIPISALYSERWRYEESTPFQREHVWPDRMKRKLVDSILRGFYIPALIVQPRFDQTRGKYYWVIDGWQRLTTIFSFMDNACSTGRSGQADEPFYHILEPNRLFDGLSLDAKERFRSYPLHIVYLDNVEDTHLGVMFRRLQNQVPLNTSEKLFSYVSAATDAAATLMHHAYFTDIFKGKIHRRGPFHASLYILLLESMDGMANVGISQVQSFAAGKRDAYISPSTIKTVERHLGEICRLFAGTTSKSTLESILLYQSVLLLELLGVDLDESEYGCLTDWMRERQKELLEPGRTSFETLAYRLQEVARQKHFWLNQLSVFSTQPGLAIPDHSYSMSQVQRVKTWIQQNGVCISCGKTVRLLDINKHIFRQEDRANKNLNTCAAVKVVTIREV